TQLTGLLPLAAARGETSYSVNGLRSEENQFLIDGISNNENHVGLGVVMYPPIDAVQEFRMETSAADARYGHGGAGTVNLVIKSGTRKYHGDLFEFARNSALDARNFFDQLKPAFRMNQFGGTFGGPFRAGKEPRTFFFTDYEGARTDQALTYISTVPTPAMRTGNFSQAPQKIFDPISQVSLPEGGFLRYPFSGNVIPPGEIDRIGSKLIDLYPLPNRPGIANNYLYQPSRRVTSDQGDFRLDHRFSNMDSGFLRFSRARGDVFQPGPLPAPAVGGTISGPISQPSYQAVLSNTHLFAPTTVNMARLGWTRVAIRASDINQDQPYSQQIGIPGSNLPGDPSTYGLPYILVTGAATLGSVGLPATTITNNYQFDENLSLIRGRHMIQIGGDFTRRQYNAFQTAFRRGMMVFMTAYSSDPASPGAGLGLADLLLGKPISGSLQFIDGMRGLRRSDIAAYVQDDYKVSTRLTLNLGLRYENYVGYPWKEVYDRAYNFLPPSGVVQVGADGLSRSGLPARNLNLMPRAGLAWRVSSRTVLRAAYGIFYSAPQIIFPVGIESNPPELISTAYTNDQFDFIGARAASAGFTRAASGKISGAQLNALDPESRLPYTQQWNASVEHQLTSDTLVSASYVGTVGTHLQGSININQPTPGITPIAVRRPFPLFQNILEIADVESSRYHSLQLTAEQRLAYGLSFNASYTWSHALDYASANVVPDTAPFLDAHNRRLDYGNADFDVRHRLVASATYVLPFKGSGILHHAARGWQLNGILNMYTGLPFTVLSASNTLNIAGRSRASYVGNGNGGFSDGTLQQWFDTSAFSAPATLQFGNVGRNTLHGPGTKQLDFSVFKNFALNGGSTRRVQFRAEAFNVTNRPQFNNPLPTIGVPGAGAITSAGSPNTFQRTSREVQLAIKVYL
ncbi:MAG TPA: TonB-dependent receptor, partial [Candidatus Solibacter sp.]|nr:TonB-dependent receptor [Candidatus Solibacter sp.]